MVKSGTVSQKADRYYVSILVEERDIKTSNSNIGIKYLIQIQVWKYLTQIMKA